MRRNLFVRLLVLFLGVAVISIAATAWITTQSTSQRLRGEFERSLEADNTVYQTLIAYAQSHDSWSGVGAMVDDLAAMTGNRVALTDADGDILADSATSDAGDSPPLPSTPIAEVDPMAPLAVMAGGVAVAAASSTVDTWMLEGEAEAGAGGSAAPPASPTPTGATTPAPLKETAPPGETVTMLTDEMTIVGSVGLEAAGPVWRLTAAETANRERLVVAANECLTQAGADELLVGPDGNVLRTYVETSDGPDPTAPATEAPVDVTTQQCVPPELLKPSEASIALNSEQVRLTQECLSAAGIEADPIQTENGLLQLRVANDDPAMQGIVADCDATAYEQAIEPYLADPALLYVGSTDRFNAFSGGGWVRTALTGLGVLAAATGVTVLAGRRLSHPIRTLTEAAQRMASGGRGARVRVTGRDEVAQLGHAFNAMASSIEQNERQRKAMVSDIAHELRTPLANVRGYLEAAEDGVVPLDPQLVSSLLEESALLQRLIDDLQDLALADAGMLRIHRETIDVADLARQVVAAHQPSASASSVELVVAAPPSVPADADPVRLRQALGNLVANAVQYSGSGSTVLVRLSHDIITDDVVLAVRDDGPGIEREHLEHLFDRFYRTDTSRTRATGGSGLGLAITKHLVEAHGGTVTVSSMVGAGSTFTIRLPAQAPEPAEAGAASSASPARG
ncbi:sensor histidine kinase [Jiangella anatolica]|uniref:histidine kinase n=1 Tax=Jiangella anatolica TaxID=2670374 RepID=A0A2W2B7A9_9ACTN|nr:ATP-binding protein [Jiangella anatolica]PZF80960.1 sensor histidine kinase [Jiangella anatolica]